MGPLGEGPLEGTQPVNGFDPLRRFSQAQRILVGSDYCLAQTLEDEVYRVADRKRAGVEP